MAFNKSVFVLASVALLFQVACGKQDNKTQERQRVNHNLTPHSGVGVKNQKLNPKAAAAAAKAADQNIQLLGQQEQQLQNATTIGLDQLGDGNYELKTITSFYNYSNTKEKLSATEVSSVSTAGGVVLTPNPSQTHSFGTMTANTDVARNIEIASTFTKNKDWKADRSQVSNVMLNDVYDSTQKQLTDSVAKSDLAVVQKVSVFGILSSSQPDSHGIYNVKDESGKNVTLQVKRTADENTLRVFISIEEKAADTSANINGSSESIFRNVYLDYTITPPAAAK